MLIRAVDGAGAALHPAAVIHPQMQWRQQCAGVAAIRATLPMATIPAIQANTLPLGEVVLENGPGD